VPTTCRRERESEYREERIGEEKVSKGAHAPVELDRTSKNLNAFD
jgi:hypothetical protein